MKNKPNNYVIRIADSPLALNAPDWNGLLATQSPAGILNPFMRHEYLAALHASGSATPDTGWTPRFLTLWDGDSLAGACALYLKAHSYGEYVFDWAWANAYRQHGLDYYPKALVAAPFTPVPGARLLARDAPERALLVKALVAWCQDEKLSSLHLLFASEPDAKACSDAGLMLRHTVQFHWTNSAPTLPAARGALPLEGGTAPAVQPSRPRGPDWPGGTDPAPVAAPAAMPPEGAGPFKNFDEFLMTLSQEKRKKIRQERRKVRDAGITFRWSLGKDIAPADWDFFYRCYEQTYLEHGNAPYLSRDFFRRMERTMPENWLLFVAEHSGLPVASSLIAVSARPDGTNGFTGSGSRTEAATGQPDSSLVAYGRYWGALARVDCLHFEACYYQPLEWCIDHGFHRFEGGAQGEHKMARALLPVKTISAHWLAHPSFADAIERFLEREGAGIDNYLNELEQRSPFKAPAVQTGPDQQAFLP